MNNFSAFLNFIKHHNRILLTTHENPDGDAIGSMLGLAYYIRSLNKDVRIVVTPDFPEYLRFVDYDGMIEVFDYDNKHFDLVNWLDAWILLDASNPKRMGSKLYSLFSVVDKKRRAYIDHHIQDIAYKICDEFYIGVVDITVSSTAELIFRLCVSESVQLNKYVAEALYIGIASDTGWFRFFNTTAETYRIASILLSYGVSITQIYNCLYNNWSFAKLRILGKALNSAVALHNNEYIRMILRVYDFDSCMASINDISGLVNYPMKISSVKISCLICELSCNYFKVSLRSNGIIDVNSICYQFGGGGHRLASGMKISGQIDEIKSMLDNAISNSL